MTFLQVKDDYKATDFQVLNSTDGKCEIADSVRGFLVLFLIFLTTVIIFLLLSL